MKNFISIFLLGITLALFSSHLANAYQAPPVYEMRGGKNGSIFPNQLPSDRDITKSVEDAIASDYYLAPYKGFIQVYTIEGIVTLSGTIDSQVIKLQMGQKARDQSGVSKVINDIEVVHLMQ